MLQLCEHFKKNGHDVALMTKPGGWLDGQAAKIGVKIYPNDFFANTLNPVKLYSALKEIKKAVRDFNPDIMACHSSVAGILGRFAIRNSVPTVFTAHGWSFNDGVPFWEKFLGIISEKYCANFCSKIICVAGFVKDLALKYHVAPSSKLAVVYNGVKTGDFDANFKFEPKGIIKIAFVARLAPPKDPLMLLRALSMLPPEKRAQYEVLIIGDGPQTPELAKIIRAQALAKNVRLLGKIEREQVMEIYKECDAFALCTKWEGFPYTVIEAMSMGLPVVSDDVGGVKEAVDENCGILVKAHDINAWKNALLSLNNMGDEKLAKMGISAYNRARDLFSDSKMFFETEKIYNKILKK